MVQREASRNKRVMVIYYLPNKDYMVQRETSRNIKGDGYLLSNQQELYNPV